MSMNKIYFIGEIFLFEYLQNELSDEVITRFNFDVFDIPYKLIDAGHIIIQAESTHDLSSNFRICLPILLFYSTKFISSRISLMGFQSNEYYENEYKLNFRLPLVSYNRLPLSKLEFDLAPPLHYILSDYKPYLQKVEIASYIAHIVNNNGQVPNSGMLYEFLNQLNRL